jgi:hypothetical protein
MLRWGVIGSVVDGRYRVLKKVALGKGEAYAVEHTVLGRRELLEIVAPFGEGANAIRRLRRGARVANRLAHPNVAAVLDFGAIAEGRAYLVRELAEGEALPETIARQGMPLQRALTVLTQLAAALENAHAHGVVHGDIRAENVILCVHHGKADVLKVIGFGRAAIIDPEPPIDPLRDVEGFGKLVLAMFPAGLPRELAGLVESCFSHDPATRAQRMRDLQAELERVPGYDPWGQDESTQPGRTLSEGPAGQAERAAYRVALMDVSELILELGHHDVRLVTALAGLQELEDELYQLDALMTSLETRGSEMESSVRRRERGLRFRLGELRFAKNRARPDDQTSMAELDQITAALEERVRKMSAELDRDLAALTDHAVSLAVSRSTRQDALNERTRALATLVDDIAPHLAADPSLAAALDRLHILRGFAGR